MITRTGLLDARHLRVAQVPTHRCECGTSPEVDMVEITSFSDIHARLRRYLWGRAHRQPGCVCTRPPEPQLGDDYLIRGWL